MFASRASSTRVIGNGLRSKDFVPGAFGSVEEEEDDDARAGKHARIDSEIQLSVLEREQKKSEQEIRLKESMMKQFARRIELEDVVALLTEGEGLGRVEG